MKTAKILGGIVGGVVALVLIALIAVWALVDPNQYKGRIEAAVKQATGRDLVLEGDLKLSVFPWVALEMGPASLSNLPGFGAEPFLAFSHAAVRVRLLPLLREQLEVAKVELDGLDLRLKKNSEGRGNWESQGQGRETPASSATPGSGPQLASIAGVKVTHGRVSFNQYTLQNFTLETGSILGAAQVPVTISFEADRGVPGERLNFTARLDVEDNPATDDIKLAAVSINGTLIRVGDDRPMHYEFSVPALAANLRQQTLSVPDFSLSTPVVKLGGKLTGTQILDDVHLSGALAVPSVVLQEVASRFGIALPKTRDAQALSSLSADFQFAYDAESASLSDLAIKLDDTTLKGSIDVALKPVALKFALAVDHIDLDRYRPPTGAMPNPKSVAANKPAPKAPGDSSAPLNAQGTFALAAAHAAGLDFTNLNVTVDMKDGITHLHPLEAQLYGGTYSGDLTYDARPATPALSMDEHLSNVDLAQLAANTKAKGRASGKANVDIKGTARGADADDILKTLNGNFEANVVNGALEGLDVGYAIALAQALLDQQTGTAVPDTKRTKFEAFKTTATITNGVAQTNDLSIISPVLKVSGKGTVNLPSSGLDLNLTASVMKSASTTAVDIPLKITGTYSDPNVRPDVTALAKGAVKDKLRDVLQKNGLGGLFGH
jgi:AsmA protein